MAHYEIEIKSLLGSKEAADTLKAKLWEHDPELTLTSTNKQLNHYFEGGDIGALYQKVEHLFGAAEQAKLQRVIDGGSSYSVRTRERDGEVLLVVKAAKDGGTSENTVTRLEFEEAVPVTLDALDRLVENAGYRYQAKWSREREEYAFKGMNVCIDKNAGYGYLAEFERVVGEEDDHEAVRRELVEAMAALGAAELPQDRLARMFAHYNDHWAEYYGTDKTFTIL